jgi:chromosome segregation ATPase
MRNKFLPTLIAIILLMSLNSNAGTNIDASGSYYEDIGKANPKLVNEAHDLKLRHETLNSGSDSTDSIPPATYTKAMLEAMKLSSKEIKEVISSQDKIKKLNKQIINYNKNIDKQNSNIEKYNKKITSTNIKITSAQEKVSNYKKLAIGNPKKASKYTKKANDLLNKTIPYLEKKVAKYNKNIDKATENISKYKTKITNKNGAIVAAQDQIDNIIAEK